MGKTVLLVALYVLLGAVGNLMLGHAMKQKPLNISYIVWGTAVMTLSYGAYLVLLREVPLSVAVPAGAATYLTVAIISRVVLNENVPAMRWIGAAVVTLGVSLVLVSDWSADKQNPPAAAPEKREVEVSSTSLRWSLPSLPARWIAWMGQPSA